VQGVERGDLVDDNEGFRGKIACVNKHFRNLSYFSRGKWPKIECAPMLFT
jgi:hypothetical protein